jgi:hypothetical protein
MEIDVFQEGGEFQTKKLGNESYSMSITLPTDDDGRLARKCPNEDCSPGYFKVRPGIFP